MNNKAYITLGNGISFGIRVDENTKQDMFYFENGNNIIVLNKATHDNLDLIIQLMNEIRCLLPEK